MTTPSRKHKAMKRTMSNKAASTDWEAKIESEDPTVNLIKNVNELVRANIVASEEVMSHIKELITDGESGLERLDLEIEEACALINRLKKRRYVFREKLETYRATVSPIRKLPPEMLLEIFLYLHEDPLPLSKVCCRWRILALAKPSLWSNITLHLSSGNLDRQVYIANLWLDRARSLPLSIIVQYALLKKNDRDALWKLLEPRFATIRDLQIRANDRAVRTLFHASPVMPLLESLSLDMEWSSVRSLGHLNAPRLRTLSLNGSGPILQNYKIRSWALHFVRHHRHRLRSLYLGPMDLDPNTYDLLRDFAELEQCHILFSHDELWLDRELPTGTLKLPNIRRLRLESTVARPRSISTFLSGLTLPSLSRLELQYQPHMISWGRVPPMAWLHTDLLSFLTRSQCKLDTLILELCRPLDPLDLYKLLCALPDLQRLDIKMSESHLLDIPTILEDMTACEDNPDPLLPHLQQFRVGHLSLIDTRLMASMVKSRVWSDPNIASQQGVARLNLITNLFALDEVKDADFFEIIRDCKDHVAQFEGVHFFEDESDDYICDQSPLLLFPYRYTSS